MIPKDPNANYWIPPNGNITNIIQEVSMEDQPVINLSGAEESNADNIQGELIGQFLLDEMPTIDLTGAGVSSEKIIPQRDQSRLEEPPAVSLPETSTSNGNNGLFTCIICKRECKTKRDLKQHERTHKKHKCDICSKELATPRTLRNHKNSFHTCAVCLKNDFESKKEVKIHTKRFHPN